MLRKSVSIITVLCMLLMLVPTIATAEGTIEVTDWAGFEAAIGQADTIVLKNDIEVTDRLGWIQNQTFNVITDGGDYSFIRTLSNDNNWMEFWGGNTIKFGSNDSGKITFTAVNPNEEITNARPFFDVNGDGDNLTFENVDFTTNYLDNDLCAVRIGNGIVTFNNCNFYHNRRAILMNNGTVNLNGGSIYENGNRSIEGEIDTTYEAKGPAVYTKSSAVLNVYGTVIRDNVSAGPWGGQGGAILHEGAAINLYADDAGNPTIISGNKVPSGTGGAIYTNSNTGVINMYNAKILNNTCSSNGGAFFIKESSTFNMYDGEISGNRITGDWVRGGAIYADKNSKLNIAGGTVSNNTGTEKGGAIDLEGGASLTLGSADSKVTFSGNVGGSGAAVFANENNTISVVNAEFFDNVPTWGDNAAIYLEKSGHKVQLYNAYFHGDNGLGIFRPGGDGNNAVMVGGRVQFAENNYITLDGSPTSVEVTSEIVTNGTAAVLRKWGEYAVGDVALTGDTALVAAAAPKFLAKSGDKLLVIGADGIVTETEGTADYQEQTDTPVVTPAPTTPPTATPSPTPTPTPVPTFNPENGVELWANKGNEAQLEGMGTVTLDAGMYANTEEGLDPNGTQVSIGNHFNDGPDARVQMNGNDTSITFNPTVDKLAGKESDIWVYVFGEFGYPEMEAIVTYDGGKTDTVKFVTKNSEGQYVDTAGNVIPGGEKFGAKLPAYVGKYANVESLKVRIAEKLDKVGLGIWKAEFLTGGAVTPADGITAMDISASKVNTVTVTSADSVAGKLFVAIYKTVAGEKQLVGIKSIDVTAASYAEGVATIAVDLAIPDGAESVQAMLWESTETLAPIFNALSQTL